MRKTWQQHIAGEPDSKTGDFQTKHVLLHFLWSSLPISWLNRPYLESILFSFVYMIFLYASNNGCAQWVCLLSFPKKKNSILSWNNDIMRITDIWCCVCQKCAVPSKFGEDLVWIGPTPLKMVAKHVLSFIHGNPSSTACCTQLLLPCVPRAVVCRPLRWSIAPCCPHGMHVHCPPSRHVSHPHHVHMYRLPLPGWAPTPMPRHAVSSSA